ncbi:MAG TPA: GEVED domain-containing protein [Hymenobacter sp.]|jgi:hypothetical protein|uniref:GEVED domain-containing protein n=1 Tax=Hymenobacter sp. TaxID=1898978 RepID=UPI002ED7B838
MRINIYAVTLGLLSLACSTTPTLAQDANRAAPAGSTSAIPLKRTCASMEVLAAQLAADPTLAQRMSAINAQAQKYAAQPATSAQRTSAVTLTIPVVVHVLYNTAAQNISDAQVASQIAVLNEDFQKLNADAANVPSAFAAAAANVNIAFTLAKRTPAGAATTGIVRKSTTRTSWPVDNPNTGQFYEYMKRSSDGGSDPWNTSQYLNLWVCNLAGGTLGYAQFPGGPAALDGVVIRTSAFGKGGSAAAPFNLGRTGTHEVGHWLNLFHIWGDDGTACTGSDQVSDTPNQADENYGVPTYPNPSCSNTSDMFMNYMDYTDDRGMYMFSNGQSSRMNALFASGGARASLKTSLGGTAPGTTTPPPTTPTYCASKGSSVAYEWLDLVQVGSINRASGADGGYYNGTALSTSVAAGSTYTLSFSTGYAGSAYTEYVKAYADWNQNGVFTDAGELIVSAAGSTSAATRSASFTVPSGAKNGAVRLRVVLSDASGTTSCGSYGYGETEDYTLNVGGGVARTEGSVAARQSGRPTGQYTLFPNPATDVLRIARPVDADLEQPISVRVFDLRGGEVRGLTFADGQLNVAALRAGIYLLTVSDGRTTTHQRFVKE